MAFQPILKQIWVAENIAADGMPTGFEERGAAVHFYVGGADVAWMQAFELGVLPTSLVLHLARSGHVFEGGGNIVVEGWDFVMIERWIERRVRLCASPDWESALNAIRSFARPLDI